MAFKYAINTSTIRCGDTSLPDMIKIAGEAGYDGIEPWIREIDAYVEAGGSVSDLKSMCEDAGLKVINLIGFFDWAVDDDAQRAAGIQTARHGFELAAAIGAPCVAAPPCGIHQQTGLDLFAIAERYAALIDVAKEYGVVPVLEFWGIAKTLGHLGEALFVAAEAKRDAACVLADVFHMYKSSGSFEGLNLIGPQTIGIFHINDYPQATNSDELSDKDRVYPGDGVAPFDVIIPALDRGGFSGMLSLELFNESYWAQDPATVAKTGLTRTRAAVQGALA